MGDWRDLLDGPRPRCDRISFGSSIRRFLGAPVFTHSLLFAAILATMVTLAFSRGMAGISKTMLWVYFFLATASHGFLDAMTNGGLGVAFFSPFDDTRYFLPWRPILVSPISATRLFSERGLAVLQSELLSIWIPAALLAVLMVMLRQTFRSVNKR